MLYIMRHGTTDWNKKHMLQGRTDVPLNDDGRLMASEAAVIYKDVHFDVCYCSPLIRARETAEIFLKGRNIPIITDDRLMEMCFGIYEGTKNYFKNSKSPVNIIFREPQSYKVPFENAESFEKLYARTGEFIKEIVLPELEKGKDILIVGHGAMNSSIVCQIKNIPIENFWNAGIENCKLMKLL